MARELEALRDKYPLLYRKHFFFECHAGWLNLLDELSAKLEALVKEAAPDEFRGEFYVIQVKEKYGWLRFYMNWSSSEMHDLIEEYEKKSTEICEYCGEEGTLRKRAWIKTLCDECHATPFRRPNLWLD